MITKKEGVDNSQTGGESPKLLRMADVVPQNIRWLWSRRIARGKLTMISGDPGLGKSLLTMDIVARLSCGGMWPDGEDIAERGGSVLLTAEDDAADTLRPRLDEAGADLEMVTLLEAVQFQYQKRKRERSFSLERDLPHLEAAIKETPLCQLVIIDPVTAYCGKVDSHNNAEVRGLLAPLSDLAQKTKVAVICVSHLNKASGSSAIYRTMGSLAFTAAARAAFVVTKDQTDPSVRLFLPVKNNIGNDRDGLKYVVKTGVSGSPFLSWFDGAVTISADEALAPSRTLQKDGKVMQAGRWLVDALANGPKPSAELFESADQAGIKLTTLKRAADELKIKKWKTGFGADGVWTWELPTESTEDDAVPF